MSDQEIKWGGCTKWASREELEEMYPADSQHDWPTDYTTEDEEPGMKYSAVEDPENFEPTDYAEAEEMIEKYQRARRHAWYTAFAIILALSVIVGVCLMVGVG